MDRNLGATGTLYSLSTTNAQNYPTYGLYYQFGRFNPIPKAVAGTVVGTQPTYQADGTTVTNFPVILEGPITPAVAIQNPQTFVKLPRSGLTNWSTADINAFWGNGTTKSVYDPCPEGWRVGPKNVWDDFGSTWLTSGNAPGPYKNPAWESANVDIGGCLYKAGEVKAFYPTQGYRNNGSGDLHDIGGNGFLWSSRTTRYQYHYLSLDYIDGSVADANAIRCIQE